MKMYCFDIDGVIIERVFDENFGDEFKRIPSRHTPKPMIENIKMINRLYDAGNYIKLYTARGTETKIDWATTTNQEMAQFGVKFHELHFGKPSADYYIDDKFIDIEQLRKGVNENS